MCLINKVGLKCVNMTKRGYGYVHEQITNTVSFSPIYRTYTLRPIVHAKEGKFAFFLSISSRTTRCALIEIAVSSNKRQF